MAAARPSSAIVYTVTLEGGQPYGIRLQGGYEFAQKLRVAKVNPNSKAYIHGVQTGDLINSINGQSTDHMNHRDALRLFQNSNNRLILEVTRSDKQSVIPVLRVESPTDSRNSDPEMLGGNQYAVAVTASMPSFQSSLYDDIGQDVTSGHETNAGQLSHASPSSAIWSPMGHSQVKTYQPIEFDPTKRNLRVAQLHSGRNSASNNACSFTDDPSRNTPSDSVTSSLTVLLAASDEDKKKKEGTTKKTNKMGWKTGNKLAEESDVQIIQNAEAPVKKLPSFGTTSSGDRNFSLADSILSPSFGVTTAKLEMIRSELPASLTLYKKTRDVETCKDAKLANISIRSTARDSKHETPSFYNNNNQLTDARQYLADNISLRSESSLNQKDWYKQVFKAIHKVDQEPESPLHVVDKSGAAILQRPNITQMLDAADGQNHSSDTMNAQNRERCRLAQKGVDIPPCGLRYVSKPHRPNQNSEFKLNQPFSEDSWSSVFDYPSQEVHQMSRSMDLDLKRGKPSKISRDDRLLSPRLPGSTRKKDDDSPLYTDEYWLGLAGLGNTDNREPAVIHRQAPVDKAAANSAKSLPCKALAVYSFKAKSEKELSFDQGDVIHLIRPIDKNWFEAEHKGAVGFVPSNYVKVTTGSAEAGEKNFRKVIAKHSFTAKFPSELSFKKGDILTVLRCIDSNWFEGKLDQRTGTFPISYVEPFTVPVTCLSRLNPSAGLDSPISISPRSSILSTTVPSGPTSPYGTYTSDHYPSDLEKNIFEFDKLCKNSQNLDVVKNDQSSKRSFNGGIDKKVPVCLGIDVSSAQRKTAENPKCCMKITCDSVVIGGKAIQSEQLKDSGSKLEADRSATPSLHLLYEEPWYQVLYNYKPQHDDELDLHEGDLIYLLERCDDGWCVGQSDRTKRVGTFPRNYVTQLG